MELDEVAVAFSPVGAVGTLEHAPPPPVELLVTVRTAELLVTLPLPLVADTLKDAPLSVATVGGVV
jgi:hypothetical protein